MLPHLIWQTFSKSSGLDITLLGQNATKLKDFDMDNRNKIINQIARHMQIALNLKYENHSSKRIDKLKINSRKESYLYLIYMLVKFLYIVNLICQLVLMDVFFEFRNYSFGFDFLKKFFRGEDYSRIDKAFPR